MNFNFLNSITKKDLFREILNKVRSLESDQNRIIISPLHGSAKAFLVKQLTNKIDQLVILVNDAKAAEELNVELGVIGLDERTILIDDFNPEQLQQKLTEVNARNKFIILSTYNILNLNFPSKENADKSTTKIQLGGELAFNELIEYLHLIGYQKDQFVETPGESSVRGSIVDFWSYSEHNPVRLEFDGDFIESIRYFDPESQRSIEKVDRVTLATSFQNDEDDHSSNIFSYLDKPFVLASSYNLNNFKYEPSGLLTKRESRRHFTSNTISDKAAEEFPEPKIMTDQSNILQLKQTKDFTNIENTTWLLEEELSSSKDRVELGFSEAPTISSNYEVLFSVLLDYAEKDFEIILTSENEIQTNRLRDLLSEFKAELAELIETKRIQLETLAIKEGFLHRNEKLLLLTDYQIFNKPYRTKASQKRKYKKSKSRAFASIKNGDYVVHENYGIGKYAGLKTINIGETKQETMKLLYNEGGIVYVNLNYLTLVKGYSSNENLVPTLSTLGTGEWDRKKIRTKKKIKEAAKELIELYAKRKATKGYQFGADTIWQKELEASFFYEDTPDQEKVTMEVKQDMEAENPMDRLVCGDVGFGKTEIAVRASFKAVQDGKQVALLVPTTILAEQHHNTFKDRLTQFPVKVSALSRFQTKKEQNEILIDLEEGKLDVVIGTHRLLSKDIKFKDLGLLMIDEEHRFGVTAKEKLRAIKVSVDTLTLTATPIPRTLNLSLLGARDLSIIATPPPNRQPIFTTVSTFDVTKIREWIYNELKRSGQVYFVHDRVQSIAKLADYLNKHIPNINIGIAHGQMKASQLEDVIHGFLSNKYDVLLSTKIIESGLDIPNVNTIIVNRADRFGLAELHQLRGRVGRSTRQAYAYFIVPSVSGITKKALRRLQAIEEFTEIGSGFNLSMRDLEIRGAGNLLGKEQTGFINEIGFDLYLKQIDEAVEELKYQEFKELFKSLPKQEEKTEPTIDTYFEIGIPDTYVPNQTDRLNFYTALYSIKNLDELNDLKEEMQDRFGPVPAMVNRLILAATLRYYASYALFERIIMQRKVVTIILLKGEKEEYYKFKFVELMRYVLEEHKETIKFDQSKKAMKLVVKNNFETSERLLEYLIRFSMAVKKVYTKETPVEFNE